MLHLDAVLSPPEIDLLPQRDLSRTLCVVFDVLRATSSMVTGLAHGTEAIRPVLTIEEAFEAREQWPGAILGGERHGDRIEGFDLGNSPLEYCAPGLQRIITTTTNGTVALRAVAGAKTVLAGALLNMTALEEAVVRLAGEGDEVLLICAGTGRDLGLEDVYAAGMLLDRLAARVPSVHIGDAGQCAQAVHALYAGQPEAALRAAANGKVLTSRGREEEVAWCASVGKLDAIGIMNGEGVLVPLAKTGA